MNRTLIPLTAVMLLAACSSSPQKPVASETPATASAATTPVALGETAEQRRQRVGLALAADSVLFDYDDFSIKPVYQERLHHDSELLKSVPEAQVRLEGNADERGSTEYNLALGQKRAEAVRRALVLLGIPDSRLEAVSYGKEKPRAECHDETCWAQNRRTDLALKQPGSR